MQQYLDLLRKILNEGVHTKNRTGHDTVSLFGETLTFDMMEGFPLVTTKKIFWRGVVAELLWMLGGGTNARPLQEQGVHIWDEWAAEDGELGKIYGYQWRNFGGAEDDPLDDEMGYDQIREIESQLIRNPDSRRLVVSAWNPSDLGEMALPPCHFAFQLRVIQDKLHMLMIQRSADFFLGVPFNIASYALLLHMFAITHGYTPGKLTIMFGDAHIYLMHKPHVLLQLNRPPLPLPQLALDKQASVLHYNQDHIHLLNYLSHSTIKADVAV